MNEEPHFKKFELSLKAARERLGKKDGKEFLQQQKLQVEELVRLETRFRLDLQRNPSGAAVYRDFVAYICEERRNILDARPYFRERQGVFNDQISHVLRRRAAKELYRFHFNYRFVQFALRARDWHPNSKLRRTAARIVEVRHALATLNLPLAISRARIFYSRTPRAHLTYMDLIQICGEALMAGIDKFVGPYSKAFRGVAIGRMVGNCIESYCVSAHTILSPCGQKPKKIKDFRCGDKILGVDDQGQTIETEVVARHDHGVLEGFEYEFDDGYRITCSENHKFLTRYGMVAIKEIERLELGVLCEPAVQDRWMADTMRSGGKTSSGDVCPQQELLGGHGATEGRVADMGYSNAPLTSTRGLVLRHIVRVRAVGPRRMYDLEVAHAKHNFLLPNGVVTSNSETSIHFWPADKRKLYRANKLVGRQPPGTVDFHILAGQVNQGADPVHTTSGAELQDLMAAASTVSSTPQAQDLESDEPREERFAAPREQQPDVLVEHREAREAMLAAAPSCLTRMDRKILLLKGIELPARVDLL